jgi:predicted DNA-binding transcriptional regulator AlpA
MKNYIDEVVDPSPALIRAIANAVAETAKRWPEEMRPATVAKYLDTTKATLYRKLIKDPTFPRPARHGARFTSFSKAEIDRWRDGQRRQP